MTILVTNDDGWNSRGLLVLMQHLNELNLGKVVALAPERNCSGLGSALSLGRPLGPIYNRGYNIHSMEGTPADCAYVGLHSDFFGGVDMLLSGVNHGDNLSTDIMSSGTIAAALQGKFLDIAPIAVSMALSDCEEWPQFPETGAQVAAETLQKLVDKKLNSRGQWGDHTILNINVPDVPYDELQGVRWTHLADRGKSGPCKNIVGGGYLIGSRGKVKDGDGCNDVSQVKNGFVSITPLRQDLTDFDALQDSD